MTTHGMFDLKTQALRAHRWVLMTVLAILLGGCGFQLRGQVDLPDSMRLITVTSPDDTTDFVRELSAQLRANGVQVAKSATANASVLRIRQERSYREALTISQDARVREYILYLEVRFDFLDADGQPVIQNEGIRLSRDYSFNEQAILGSSREEEILAKDLARALASMVVRQLASQLSDLSSNPPAHSSIHQENTLQ